MTLLKPKVELLCTNQLAELNIMLAQDAWKEKKFKYCRMIDIIMVNLAAQVVGKHFIKPVDDLELPSIGVY